MGLFHGTSLQRPVTCEHCGLPHAKCTCPRGKDGKILLPKDQPARVQREKRRGKWVTVISGIDPHATDLKALAKDLRSRLGAGGSVKDGLIEIQGDHKAKALETLTALGYPAKGSGG